MRPGRSAVPRQPPPPVSLETVSLHGFDFLSYPLLHRSRKLPALRRTTLPSAPSDRGLFFCGESIHEQLTAPSCALYTWTLTFRPVPPGFATVRLNARCEGEGEERR